MNIKEYIEINKNSNHLEITDNDFSYYLISKEITSLEGITETINGRLYIQNNN